MVPREKQTLQSKWQATSWWAVSQHTTREAPKASTSALTRRALNLTRWGLSLKTLKFKRVSTMTTQQRFLRCEVQSKHHSVSQMLPTKRKSGITCFRLKLTKQVARNTIFSFSPRSTSAWCKQFLLIRTSLKKSSWTMLAASTSRTQTLDSKRDRSKSCWMLYSASCATRLRVTASRLMWSGACTGTCQACLRQVSSIAMLKRLWLHSLQSNWRLQRRAAKIRFWTSSNSMRVKRHFYKPRSRTWSMQLKPSKKRLTPTSTSFISQSRVLLQKDQSYQVKFKHFKRKTPACLRP